MRTVSGWTVAPVLRLSRGVEHAVKLSTARSTNLLIKSPLTFLFTHQPQEVSIRVAEECHPQLVVRHFRDVVRLGLERNAAGHKLLMRYVDIRHLEIQGGPETLRVWLFGP